MTHRFLAIAVVASIASSGCSKDSSPSPTSPSPSTPTVTAVSISGCQQAQNFQCTATATMSSGSPQNVTSLAQWSSTNTSVATISAGGVLSPLQTGTTDIRATYQSVAGTASVTITMNNPPAASTWLLQGVVTESAPTATVPIVGARVEIVDGANAGRAATTDGNGYYALSGLTGSTFTLRTTHAAYQIADRPVTLSRDTTMNVTMRPNPQQLDDSYTGQISGGDPTTCSDGVFVKPCKRISLPIHNDGALSAEMDWVGGSADLDLTLWRGSTLVARAVGVGSRESITSNVVGGSGYELRITYYSGSNTVEYRLRVRRPN
jgi:hypothetical protein